MMRAGALAIALALSAMQPNRTAEMLHEWADAVVEHRAGEDDEALSALADWSYDDLETMQPFLEAFVGKPERNDDPRAVTRRARLTGRDKALIRELSKDRLGADPNAFRRRAAMLHTDAAVLLDPPAATAPADDKQSKSVPYWARTRSSRRVDVISIDAEYQNVQYANPHWEIAMDMLDAVVPPRDPFVAQWFADIGIYLVEQRRYNDGLAHFDRARRLVLDDAGVLFAEARLHEALSAPRMQNLLRTAAARGVLMGGIDERRTELKRAEMLLQKALAGNSSFDEARLRMAHVIMQLDRWEEGLKQVQQIRAGATNEHLMYYANLFAGEAALALGRAGDAAKSFEHALDLFPRAQAAQLGLGASLRLLGERQTAIDAVMSTIMLSPDARDTSDEPWWVYYVSDGTEESTALERVRASIREPRK
jgi:tetratricopeptide (TPR) repeat protein